MGVMLNNGSSMGGSGGNKAPEMGNVNNVERLRGGGRMKSL